ncbi:phosphotransferase [Brachybacterium sp. AOP43-C2-M15]|uniref:phosphotransferase n=1 Tax=Brachybacterium sp. AOP43-C2-M15 TaxID=3457661 RepID=UPI0040346B91
MIAPTSPTSPTSTTSPSAPNRSPLEHLLAHARLDGAASLLDPARLSTLLGREIALDRVRIKPAASVLVSYRASGSTSTSTSTSGRGAVPTAATGGGPEHAGGGAPVPGEALADVGWALLVASSDKRENLLRRAAKTGIDVREHDRRQRGAEEPGVRAHEDLGTGPFLLSGGLDSDPRLGREIDRVLRRQPAGSAPRVLSYNPGRHAMLLLPASGEVLRVAARPLDDMLAVGIHWRELGLPTLEQHRWRNRPRVLAGARWGSGDLAGLAAHPRSMPAAARLGEIIARLHDADVSGRDLPPARIGEQVPVTTEAVADLLPQCADRIEDLSRRLRGMLPESEEQVLIHGDLSPDQVLVSVDETALPGRGRLPLRVVDLDRSGLGPAGADLGSWLATCLLADVEEQASAFLEGYARRRALPAPEVLAAWTARALLAAALDPLRRYREDWLPRIERRLALAEAVLDRPPRLSPAPSAATSPPASAAAPSAPTPTAEAERAPLVPLRIEHEGRVLTVRRAWADDGRGMPLELTDEEPALAAASGHRLRGARLDPSTGRTTVFAPGTDPRLPGLARVLTAHPGAELVSHRPGKRAVVRTEDAEGQARFVKIVRPGRAARLLAAVERAAAFQGPFRTAAVLAADEDTVTFAALPGQLLHSGLPVEGGTWGRAWRETLEAWSAAVASSRTELRRGGSALAPGAAAGSGAAGAAVHGPSAEAQVLTDWCERAASADPAGAGARRRAVAAAQRELTRLGQVGRPALIHRDLHDKQILWQEGTAPALLDVDTAAVGDPALDAGNLRAHATWRALQGLWSPEQVAVVHAEVDRAAARSDLDPEALAAYETATLARLTCVYAFRPRWRALARELAVSLDPVPGPERAPRASDSRGVGPTPSSVGPTSSSAEPGSSTDLPAPAGDPTPWGGAATPLERSMSR